MTAVRTMGRAQDAITFGKLVRAERKALGFTQEKLAHSLGIRRQSLMDLEAGKNVGIHFAFAVLGGLGKMVSITDARPDMETIRVMLGDDDG